MEMQFYVIFFMCDLFSCLLCLLWAVVTHSWQEFPTCRHTEYLTVFSYFWIQKGKTIIGEKARGYVRPRTASMGIQNKD